MGYRCFLLGSPGAVLATIKYSAQHSKTQIVVFKYLVQGCQVTHPNWFRFAPYETNLGLFKISLRHLQNVLDFLRSVSVDFDSPNKNIRKLILKVPDLSHLTQSVEKFLHS